jgi:hypothetical protein
MPRQNLHASQRGEETDVELRIWIGVVAVLAALASAPAWAGDSGPWGAACTKQAIASPFARWSDGMPYTLVPGGTFEAPGWAVADGAAIVGGNEPFYVHGAGERTSMLLPPGASATSKPMCVSLQHPTIRMFVRNLGSRFSFFRLQAIYKDSGGTLRTVEFAKLAATPKWAPSPAIPYLVNVDVPLDGNGTTAVAFRFVGATGVTLVDDVYVDPRKWG